MPLHLLVKWEVVSPNSRWGQLESISDIDGMLFEFVMNFLNIEKNKILRIFFSKFHVFFTFHAISNIKKKIRCTKKFGGGGGG